MASTEDIEDWFADNYVEARENFLETCKKNDLPVQSYINDCAADGSNELACDVVRIGEENAGRLLVLTSGVHGAELMCGSGCQAGLIGSGYFDSLPQDTAVLMIHAINPWGADRLRRNNEDNIDLCRNFVDFSTELPVNENYEAVHAMLCADSRPSISDANTSSALMGFISSHGKAALVSTIMCGQYKYEDGMSYGGKRETWSHKTTRDILEKHARSAGKVCLLDYHSGLGPWAEGTVVCLHKGEALERARKWFGENIMTPMDEQGSENFHPALGHTTEGYIRMLANREVTSIVLEYGTYDMDSNLQALLDDHWCMFRGEENSEQGRKIKRNMLNTHYPDDPAWREAVWTRSKQVVAMALEGLDDD